MTCQITRNAGEQMKYLNTMESVFLSELKKQLPEHTMQLIQHQEQQYQQKISWMCQEITKHNSNIILLTGPSASGKTTTAIKLLDELKKSGKKVCRISLDNFYKNNEDQPRWKDGQKNFETIESLDITYFHEKISELLTTGYAEFPLFDFPLGMRSSKTFPLNYDSQTYLIFEGIHALNPLLCEHLHQNRIIRIYVSVHSDFINSDGKVILKARNLRLLRRLLRDRLHRDADALETLELWKYVLRGEKLYIKPFRKCADIHINSTHHYEPFLYKESAIEMLTPLLADPNYGKLAQTLISGLNGLPEISKDQIPKNSLIQEFIS